MRLRDKLMEKGEKAAQYAKEQAAMLAERELAVVSPLERIATALERIADVLENELTAPAAGDPAGKDPASE